HRARCTHLQTQPGRIQPIDSSQLGEIVAALRPYRHGTLRVSMAAGGLPVTGMYPLDDPEAALQALSERMPIAIKRLTPWFVSINVETTI
ncbi:hypothetical protein L573_0882, partial [Bordetella holmesii H620]